MTITAHNTDLDTDLDTVIITTEMLNMLELASPFAFKIWQQEQRACTTILSLFALNYQLMPTDISHLVYQYTHLNHEILDDNEVMIGLRKLRKILMFRWIWQDALHEISVINLVNQLSDFADACIAIAKERTFLTLTQRYGRPVFFDKKGKHHLDDMAILAMGKLGARELNLSSDIDLVFVHQAQGDTDITGFEGAKSIENQKFMTKLGQGIIKILDTHTKDGFVFRVDMRLRPWGDGSALVIPKKGLNNYLTKNGRAWERFAWLKARVVNDIDNDFYESLEQITHPFIFKHYVDYSAFASLREMKILIENQVAQRQDLNNIKLGAGGIRDIEFIIQAYQLIYGGRYHELQVKACLDAMTILHQLQYLTTETYQQLTAAYIFLRRLEHGIQAIHDQQTQSLPTDSTLQANLARILGFTTWQDLMQTLTQHRNNVSIPFNKLVIQRKKSVDTSQNENFTQPFFELLTDENQQKLTAFQDSKLIKNLSTNAAQHLHRAYPILMKALCLHEEQQGTANIAFPRLLTLLESICRRSIYLIMLAENPNATIALIPVLSSSPWIARELSQYPVLLDTFIQQKYHHLPSKAELTDIMRQRLLRVEPNDEETLLSVLRLFKKMQVLAVAASDIVDKRSIMKVSDSLTYIAEVVLETTLQRVFAELSHRYGLPLSSDGERVTADSCGLAIIGYGKLGGFELSYSSDLDLVFIHSLDERALTDGEKAINGMQFATKIVRKVMTYLASQTRDGRAYEVDIRLRPSGNSGMLIISETAFEKYQLEKAWYWEHQALVRARSICGDKKLMQRFDSIRYNVLSQPREKSTVADEVIKMREKMKAHLGSKTITHESSENVNTFNLKQDAGGMVDIEFMAQYAVLAYADKFPHIVTWTDNVRIFEQLAVTDIWSEKICKQLTESYLLIRIAVHTLALNNQNNNVNNVDWLEVRAGINDLWCELIVKEASHSL